MSIKLIRLSSLAISLMFIVIGCHHYTEAKPDAKKTSKPYLEPSKNTNPYNTPVKK